MPEKPTLAGPVYDWLMSGQRAPAGENVLHVTELVAPAPTVVLKREHAHQIEITPDSMFNLRLGTAVHDAIEAHAKAGAPPGTLIEQPLEQDVEVDGEVWTIKGTPDYWFPDSDDTPDVGHLWDWKTCAQYKVTLGDFADWEAQIGGCYVWMIDKVLGKQTLTAQVQAFMKDHSVARSAHRSNDPKSPIAHIPLTIWTPEQTEEWIAARITLYKRYRDDYRMGIVKTACSEKDRWKRNSRCEFYCSSRPFCPMWINKT